MLINKKCRKTKNAMTDRVDTSTRIEGGVIANPVRTKLTPLIGRSRLGTNVHYLVDRRINRFTQF